MREFFLLILFWLSLQLFLLDILISFLSSRPSLLVSGEICFIFIKNRFLHSLTYVRIGRNDNLFVTKKKLLFNYFQNKTLQIFRFCKGDQFRMIGRMNMRFENLRTAVRASLRFGNYITEFIQF